MVREKSSRRPSPLYVIFGVLLAFTLGYVAITTLWARPRRYIDMNTRSRRPTYTARPSLLEWKLYGDSEDHRKGDRSNHRTGANTITSDSANDWHSSNSARVLLETVSKSFQEHLHVGTPLFCHTGEEGLISVKYERFLKTLVNYTSFHNLDSVESNTRTLVWRCAWREHCGGLVDRLKGITYTLLLAIFSRRRLVLNWGGLERTYLTPNLIDWTDGPVFSKGKTKQQYPVFHLMDGGHHVDSKGEDIKVTFESIGNETDSGTVVVVSNSMPRSLQNGVKTAHQKWIQNGLRQTGLDSLSPDDLDNVVGIVFRYLFQTKPELLEEVAHARNVLGLDGRPYTGVHIRTGFSGSSHSQENNRHPVLIRNDSVWEDMLKCAISTADTLLGNSSLLFLATDSMLVKHLAVSKYGGRFRTLNNSLVHVDHLKFARKRAPSLNEKEGILVGLVEFILLAEAYSHVRGFSGYSWVAGLLCSLPGERVIDGLKCVPESQVKRFGCSGGPYCFRHKNR